MPFVTRSRSPNTDSLPTDILDFEQLEKESIGVAWARFSRLLASIPDMSIPDEVSLEVFYSGLEILGMTQEALQRKLFPFSLIERAEQWYTRTIGNMSGDWEELRDDFCYSFSLTERIESLQRRSP